MLTNYFTIAWRNLVKYKGYTIINVLGLAIGISACLIIYLITSFELGFDTFHPDKDRIYRVVSDDFDNTYGKRYSSGTPYEVALAIRNEFTGVDEIGTFYDYTTKVKIPNGRETKKFDIPESREIIIAEPQYFTIFKYEWLAGSASAALNQPLKVVLTESKARLYFGSMPIQDIIGKEVIYDDSLHTTVAGIVKDLGKRTDLVFRDFISYSTIQGSFLKDANGHPWPGSGQTFVKLAKGANPRQIELQTVPVIKRMFKKWKVSADRQRDVNLQPLSDLHFNVYYRDFYSRQAHLPTLYALMGIAAFILIIAAINFINLSTAQSFQRVKEIGIRKVLGSSRTGLVMQLLGETGMLTLLAVMLSLLMINPVLNAFRELIPKGVAFNPASPSTLIFVLLVAVITALLAGLYPAKILSSYLPALSLKGQGTHRSSQKGYLRKTLIVFQFTVSLFFIIGAIIIGSQIHYMLNKDTGFQKDAILTINVKGNYPGGGKFLLQERIRDLAKRIRQLPGIANVSLSNQAPEVTYTNGGWLLCKDKERLMAGCEERVGDEQYIPLYGFRLVAGRNFMVPAGSDSLTEFLINESCARQLGFTNAGDAIGHMVQPGFVNKDGFHPWWGGVHGPVVGVLADFHTRPLYSAVAPTYLFASTSLSSLISIKLSGQGKLPDNFETTMNNIEKYWKELYPDERFEYRFYDETLARYYDKEKKTGKIMNIAMSIAIFISCMGLFGLAAFTAEQRTKEIGIRKVLGATISGIVMMLSKDFMKPVVISILIASPIAWFCMNRWLQDFAYRIPIHWWIFVLAGLCAIFIAQLTVSFMTIKAALSNPAKSLRTDG